jgi:uncharacterized protein YnzC (UPF0291/DUF896 family)
MVDIDRINYLSRKSRITKLSPEEKEEQQKLRQKYIDSVKNSLTAQLENTYVVDEKGTKCPIIKKDN